MEGGVAEVADEVGEEAGEGTEAASERLLLVLRLCLPLRARHTRGHCWRALRMISDCGLGRPIDCNLTDQGDCSE